MELKKLWHIILNRKWIAIQAFLVITLTVVVGSLLTTPIYRSSGKIIVEEKGLRESLLSTLGLKDMAESLSLGESFGSQRDLIKTQIELIATQSNLKEVINQLQLKNDDGNPYSPGQIGIEASQIGKTNLIRLSTDSSNPEKAANIINKLIEVHIESGMEKSKKASRSITSYITQQQENIENNWNSAIDEWVKFMSEENITDIDLEKQLNLQRLSELHKLWKENEKEINSVQSKIAEIKKQLAKISKYQVTSRSAEKNPQLQDLKKQLIDLNVQLESGKTKYTASHPVVIDLQNQIRAVRNQLNNQIKKTFKDEAETINPFYQSLIQQLGDNEILLADLKSKDVILPKTINEYVQKLSAFPLQSAKFQRLLLEIDMQSKAMTFLLEKSYQTKMASLVKSSNIRLVEEAQVPGRPIKPKLLLNTVAAMFLGLFFGLGLVLLMEYLDDTLKSPDDLKEFAPMPLLGIIPKLKKEDISLISAMDSRKPMPEAYRTIKNNIRFGALDKQLRVVLVTSAFASEGKSFTAGNLAISFSRDNFKVLLIDIDLRRPSLHKLFKAENKAGLSNLIRDDKLLMKDVIQKTGIEGVYLLPTGPLPPNPDQFIESPRIPKIIEKLKERFDMLIIDTPPILATHDSIILSKYTDATIDVIEAGKITRKALAHTKESMEKAKIPFIGVIFNKFDQDSKDSYYYYTYYHSDEK